MATTKQFRVKHGLDASNNLISFVSDPVANTDVATKGYVDLLVANANTGGVGGGASVEVSNTAPVSANTGDMWFDTTTGVLNVYYDGYWVESSASGSDLSVKLGDFSPLGSDGQVWFNTNTQILNVYANGAWQNTTVNLPANTSTASASYDNGTGVITFTRDDTTTYTVDVSNLIVANTGTSNAVYTHANDTITFTRDDNTTFDVNLQRPITIANTAPTGTEGDMWFDETSGILNIYYQGYWVESSASASGGGGGGVGEMGDYAPLGVDGAFFYNTTTDILYLYANNNWEIPYSKYFLSKSNTVTQNVVSSINFEQDVYANSLVVNTSLQFGASNNATLSWNSVEGTIDIAYDGATLQVGQEQHYYAKATENIDNGELVMFAGVQGDHALIALADPTAPGFIPEWIMGVATESMLNNEFGYVTAFGKVRGIDTRNYGAGALLYMDPSTPGGMTTTEPPVPDHSILIAASLNSTVNGTILVRISHKTDLDELHGVDTTGKANNDVLVWNTANNKWEASNGYATKVYVDTSISNLVNTAPTTLNTLQELASALGNDENYATTTATLIGTKAGNSFVTSTYVSNATYQAFRTTVTDDIINETFKTKSIVAYHNFDVTVNTKSVNHPYYGQGSANSFRLNQSESPTITLIPGHTYRFDQSDASNVGHPLRLYRNADRSGQLLTGVTEVGTPGSAGAYTEFVVTHDTPVELYYQCGNHAYMGHNVVVSGGYNELFITVANAQALIPANTSTETAVLTGNTIIFTRSDSTQYAVSLTPIARDSSNGALETPISITTSNSAPTANVSYNDLWFDSATGGMYVYYYDGNNAQWVQIRNPASTMTTLANVEFADSTLTFTRGNEEEVVIDLSSLDGGNSGGAAITVSNTQPTGTANGELWFDSSANTLYVFNDIYWIATGSQDSGGGASVNVGNTAPTEATQGDMYFDEDYATLYVYYANTWVEVLPNNIADNPIEITVDSYTANGSATTFEYTSDISSAKDLIVTVDGLVQRPTDDYTVNGSNVIFTEAISDTSVVAVRSLNGTGAGSGTGGGISYAEATANTDATAGYKYIVDSTSVAVTIVLPTTAELGDEVGVMDGVGNASVNNITVDRNGHNIQGAAENLTIDVDRAAFTLVYYNTTQGWLLTEV